MLTDVIGYIATALIVVAYIPQTIQTYQTESAEGVNSKFLILMIISCSLWIVYSVLIASLPLLLTNSLSLMQILYISFFKLKTK